RRGHPSGRGASRGQTLLIVLGNGDPLHRGLLLGSFARRPRMVAGALTDRSPNRHASPYHPLRVLVGHWSIPPAAPKATTPMTLDVRLLGPLEVRVDGRPVTIPRGNVSTVLALLLDDADRVVPLSGLVVGVYGDDLPLDPETQVQNTVGVLRRRLGAARDRVETVGRAYRLRIAESELDTLRCKAKEVRARELRREGRKEEAAAVLREA